MTANVKCANIPATAPMLPTEILSQTSPLLHPLKTSGHAVDVRLIDVNHCQTYR